MKAVVLTKGQTVTLTHPNTGRRVSGVLETATAKTLKVILEEDGKLVGYFSNARFTKDMLIQRLDIKPHEGTPISERLQRRIDLLNGKGPSFSKGQVVAFYHGGTRCTGRVLKAGKKPRVSLNMDTQLNIPPTQLELTESPIPDPELAEWDVDKMTEQGMGRGFPMFTARVTRNGKPVFNAVCLGDGGVLRYDPVKEGSMADIQAWKEALSAYMNARGAESAIPDELWPEYAWEMKPTGMTFADYLEYL